MAKPNYSFEKRQRELAKKKKKEEKVKEKAGRKVDSGHNAEGAPDDSAAEQPGVPVAGQQMPESALRR